MLEGFCISGYISPLHSQHHITTSSPHPTTTSSHPPHSPPLHYPPNIPTTPSPISLATSSLFPFPLFPIQTPAVLPVTVYSRDLIPTTLASCHSSSAYDKTPSDIHLGERLPLSPHGFVFTHNVNCLVLNSVFLVIPLSVFYCSPSEFIQ